MTAAASIHGELCGCVAMTNPNELRAEAKELYAQARQIDDENERLSVVSRALELEMAAETQVTYRQPSGNREIA